MRYAAIFIFHLNYTSSARKQCQLTRDKKFFAHSETGAVLRKLKIRLNRTVLPNYTEVVASNV